MEPEGALVRVGLPRFVYQPSPVHHEHAVAERQDLRELGGDQQDRASRPPLIEQAAVEERDRAEVDAASGIRGEYHQLGIFLSKIANLERIVNVSNLMVKPGDDKQEGGRDRVVRSYTVEAELTLTAYTLVEGGETSNEKANAKP